MLTPILDGVFGVWGLHLRPEAQAPRALPPHLLSAMVDLACTADGRCAGDASCEPDRLPFASESFKLVIAQHVFEQVASPDAVAGELARVLAPEGIALVFGFNPVSLWRPWLARRLAPRWQFRAASNWRALFGRLHLDVLQIRYSGLLGPWAAAHAEQGTTLGSRSFGGPFGGSWLMLVRKRRSALTPLRLGASRADIKLNPSLVPGAQREYA